MFLCHGKRVVKGEYVEGFYIKNFDCESQKNQSYIQTFKKGESGEIIMGGCFKVTTKSIGVYTGVRDKNGVKVFTKSVIRVTGGAGKTDYKVCFGEYEQDGSGGEYSTRRCKGFYAEVIKTNDSCISDYNRTISLLEIPSFEVVEGVSNTGLEARWKGAGMGDNMCSLCGFVMSGHRNPCPKCEATMDPPREDHHCYEDGEDLTSLGYTREQCDEFWEK